MNREANENPTPPRRAKTAVTLAAVFAVGALGGGVLVMATDAWSHAGRWVGSMGHHGDPERWKGHMEDHALYMLERVVDVTDEQREAIREIIGETAGELAGAMGEPSRAAPRMDLGARADRARRRGPRGASSEARGPPGSKEPRGARRRPAGGLGAHPGAKERARFRAQPASGPARTLAAGPRKRLRRAASGVRRSDADAGRRPVWKHGGAPVAGRPAIVRLTAGPHEMTDPGAGAACHGAQSPRACVFGFSRLRSVRICRPARLKR